MKDERMEDLAALFALDLLEGKELEEFRAALGQDPELRARVAGLREAAALLAHAAPAADPPAELRRRVLGSVAAGSAPRSAWPAFIPWALAACLAVAAVGAGGLYYTKSSEASVLREEQRLADLEMQSMRNQMAAERIVHERELADARRQVALLDRKLRSETDLAKYKIAALVSMLHNSPEAMAVAVWNPMDQEGMLKVTKLPMAPSDEDYQLWVMDSDYPAPLSGGVFQVDPASGEAHVKFTSDKKIMSPIWFAVTLERKGGMPSPHGKMVLHTE